MNIFYRLVARVASFTLPGSTALKQKQIPPPLPGLPFPLCRPLLAGRPSHPSRQINARRDLPRNLPGMGPRRLALACIFLASSLLNSAGCWGRREITDITLEMASGIDYWAQEDQVRYTALVARPDMLAGTGDGGGGGGSLTIGPVWIAEASGESIFEAFRNLAGRSPRRNFPSHSFTVVIGEEQAQRGVGEVIDFYLRKREQRLLHWVLVARGKAEDVLKAQPELEDTIAEEINGIIDTLRETSSAPQASVMDLAISLLQPGGDALLPAIEIQVKEASPEEEPVAPAVAPERDNSAAGEAAPGGSREDPGKPATGPGREGTGEPDDNRVSSTSSSNSNGDMEGVGGNDRENKGAGGNGENNGDETFTPRQHVIIEGAAAFAGDKMVGYLSVPETKGALWVRDQLINAVYKGAIPGDPGEGEFTAIVRTGRTELKPRFQGGRLLMDMKVFTKADLTSYTGTLDLNKPETVGALDQRLAILIREEIMQAVEKSRELRSDFLNLGAAFRRENHREWAKVKDNWREEGLPRVEVNIEVEAKIRRPGLITRPLIRG